MAEPADELRTRFEQHKDRINHKRQEAEKLKAQADAIDAQTNAQLARIQKGPPSPDACPDCWVEGGREVTVVARAADDPSRFDRWGCPKCGYMASGW